MTQITYFNPLLVNIRDKSQLACIEIKKLYYFGFYLFFINYAWAILFFFQSFFFFFLFFGTMVYSLWRNFTRWKIGGGRRPLGPKTTINGQLQRKGPPAFIL